MSEHGTKKEKSERKGNFIKERRKEEKTKGCYGGIYIY